MKFYYHVCASRPLSSGDVQHYDCLLAAPMPGFDPAGLINQIRGQLLATMQEALPDDQATTITILSLTPLGAVPVAPVVDTRNGGLPS